MIRRSRLISGHAQNVEAPRGSLAASLPTRPTTIYARLNVRDANSPKCWRLNLNSTCERQTDFHCNSQSRSNSDDPLSTSHFAFWFDRAPKLLRMRLNNRPIWNRSSRALWLRATYVRVPKVRAHWDCGREKRGDDLMRRFGTSCAAEGRVSTPITTRASIRH